MSADYFDDREDLADESECEPLDSPIYDEPLPSEVREDLADESECEPLDSSIYDPSEPEDTENVDHSEPITEQKKGFVTGRRALIAGLLAAAVAGGGVGAYSLLHKPSRPGSELMTEYGNIQVGKNTDINYTDYKPRELQVVKWIKEGYITDSSEKFTTVTVTNKRGSTAEFEIMIHEIRMGTDDSFYMIPLDGAHSWAACKVLGYELPTRWMAHELRRKVFKEGGNLALIDYEYIKRSLGEVSESGQRSWTLKNFGGQKGPEESEQPKIIKGHGDLFMKFLAQSQLPKDQKYVSTDAGVPSAQPSVPSADAGTTGSDSGLSPQMTQRDFEILKPILPDEQIKPDQPISGHFKEVIQDPSRSPDGLATYRACEYKKLADKWEEKTDFGCSLVADCHPAIFFDYSHGVRCVKPKIKVKVKAKKGDGFDEKTMTLNEFYASPEMRAEFGLGGLPLREPPYSFEKSPALAMWLTEVGVLKKPEGSDAGAPKKGGEKK